MRIFTTAAFLGAALAFAATTQAQSRTFNLTLLGANEPNAAGELGQGDPDGQAIGSVTLDATTDMVSWDFDYTNISGERISGFHIHGPNATTTTNLPVFIGFPLSSTAVPAGEQTGMVMSDTIPDIGSRIDQILANPQGFYLNLHSSGVGGFPPGAVRRSFPSRA